jgi:hypothetical protein
VVDRFGSRNDRERDRDRDRVWISTISFVV